MNTLEYLIEKISEERTRIGDCLLNNSASDYSEYQFLCGQARGLLAALTIVEDLKTHLEQDDD